MKIFKLFFMIILVVFIPDWSYASSVNTDSYEIETKFELNSTSIEVSALCQIHASDSISAIQFLFNSESNIHSIEFREKDNWLTVPYKTNGKDSLLLMFDNTLDPDNKYSLRFKYSFPCNIDNDTAFIIDRGNRWYPLIIDQIASFNLVCNVPKEYDVLTSGNLVSVNNHENSKTYTWESKTAVFKMPLIIFNPVKYKKVVFDSSGINIDFYYLHADSIEAASIVNEAARCFSYYSKNIGSYSYKKLKLFEVTQWDGINTGSGIIMAGTKSIEMMKKKYYESLNLTIAQQWFGAGVFAKYGEKGFWFLSLSIPHFLRIMYLREVNGNESFLEEIEKPFLKYKEFAGKENDIPIINITSLNSREKSLIIYGKGPYILKLIEDKMGRSRWLSFLQKIYKFFYGRILTYHDFEEYISQYDDNENFKALLNKLTTHKGIHEE